MNKELLDNIGTAIFSLPEDVSNQLLSAVVNMIAVVYNSRQQSVQTAVTSSGVEYEVPIPVPVPVRTAASLPQVEAPQRAQTYVRVHNVPVMEFVNL